MAAIQAVYAHHVLHGTGSFEEQPPDLAQMRARVVQLRRSGWPVLVADRGQGPVGYAYYRQYRDRSAYRFTVEDSIYVHPDAQGRGIGKALLAALILEAERGGLHQMVAVIGDSANAASIALHAGFGFRHKGVLEAIGFKFGRWLDSVQMQKTLEPAQPCA